MSIFFQLYKLLSTYNTLLKASKSGNCQVIDDSLQKQIIPVSVSDIKHICSLKNLEKQIMVKN